jgi:hypothetical protein
VNTSRVINIEDLRRLAQRRLPKSVFDYLDGGAEAEVTLRENCRVFSDVLFRPRSAVAVGDCDLRTRVLGHELSFPAMLAPVGYSRLMHPAGELAAAHAAGEAGTGYILSTISAHKLEDVKAASKGLVWYQLYLLGGRGAAEGSLDRARRAGFSALVITVDTPVAGLRERDPRNGMKEMLGSSWFAKIPYLPDIFAHPGWLASFLLDGGMPKLENIVVPGEGPMNLLDVGRPALDSRIVDGTDRGQRPSDRRRRPTGRGRRRRRGGRVEPRWPPTRFGFSHSAGASGSGGGSEGPGRSAYGRRGAARW